MLHSRSPWMVGGYVGIHRATRGAAAAYRNSLTNSRLSPPHSAAPSLPPLIFSVSEIRFWSPARKEGGGRADGRGSASANQTRPMSDVAAAAARGRFSLYHQQVLLHAATDTETSAQRVWSLWTAGNHRTGDKSTRRVDSV